MSQMLEPTPSEIKEQKIYQEMGLSDEEFELAEKMLGRTPNYTETGLFPSCGLNTAATKAPSLC